MDVEQAKAALADAQRRGDTRAIGAALERVKRARTAQLQAEVAKRKAINAPWWRRLWSL